MGEQMNFLNGYSRLVRGVDQWALNLAAAMLLAIVCVNALSIFFRYVVEAPLSWSEEAMRYGNIWVTYLGAIAAQVRSDHMRLELPYASHPTMGQVLRLFGAAAAIVLALFLVWLGTRGALAALGQRSPSARIPMSLPYAAVPLAGIGILLAAGYSFLCALRRVEEVR
ncbi:TRAP transporter small permease [Actibacterium mucosum]|uniref:TRAP transporter small permease n=1 Tax=Actibacterium mucosum TaxID=1087332 RepID=UPI0013778110|nr:TRAP transporter small permease subunit [Actibacterium mucosum]